MALRLKAVNDADQSRFDRSFHGATLNEQGRIVELMARNEGEPRTVLERFFSVVKQATVKGYYTSRVGIEEDLRYRGNTALSEFAGRTHPDTRAEASQ